MRPMHYFHASAIALGLSANMVTCFAQAPTDGEYQEIIKELQEQNKTLQRSLSESNRSGQQATEQLAQVRLGLEALGKNLLDGGNDRQIQAVAELEIARERNTRLENSIAQLTSAINNYLRQAVVSDPAPRVRVETSLRELDAILGLRQKPLPDVRTGSLQQARIVSIDQESGMLVLNLGESQGAKIGMTFRLTRGDQPYGKAILADSRKGVSGAFVEILDNVTETPRPGDLAILETQASAQ